MFHLSPTVTQKSHWTIDSTTSPSSCYPSCYCKSTQLPNFIYSTYFPSFAYFPTSIENMFEPSSYKESIFDLI